MLVLVARSGARSLTPDGARRDRDPVDDDPEDRQRGRRELRVAADLGIEFRERKDAAEARDQRDRNGDPEREACKHAVADRERGLQHGEAARREREHRAGDVGEILRIEGRKGGKGAERPARHLRGDE